MLDAQTGDIVTVVTADAVRQGFGNWLMKEFGNPEISIFFPVLSPDRSRVFFKIAAGSGGRDFMSKDASHRQGLICFDLERKKFLFLRETWGHPAWHPDSSRIIEMGNLFLDAVDGSATRIPQLPQLRGSHPSISPDGRLLVTDGLADSLGGPVREWGVMVGDIRHGRHAFLHRFDNSRGANSWRKSHPHPAFSSDGHRVYFNVSSDDFTQLFVAESAPE
jgi:Tol biopolymer transport system component